MKINSWNDLIQIEQNKTYYKALQQFITDEENKCTVLPKKEERFTFFTLTPLNQVKVVILGQDPYHNIDQAHGLAFSVKNKKLPPSLNNIFKELVADLKITFPTTGNLSKWAKQGVLLLNTVLTVRLHEPLSHQKKGWEHFTLEIIKTINDNLEHIVFILWGNHAKKYRKYIDDKKHYILESAHPSPLSAHRGFFGSNPFSKTNAYLKEKNLKTIDWKLD